jgi:hypothetical protein
VGSRGKKLVTAGRRRIAKVCRAVGTSGYVLISAAPPFIDLAHDAGSASSRGLRISDIWVKSPGIAYAPMITCRGNRIKTVFP